MAVDDMRLELLAREPIRARNATRRSVLHAVV